MRLKSFKFRNCRLQEVDFTEADLTGAVFDHCELAGAVFSNMTLEKADFRKAEHYSIDPENNRIKKAKFSATGLSGLLTKYKIEIS
jgi:fluoroquinolone resistance protein